MKKIEIPGNIISVIQEIEKNGFEAFVVGGCVRDLLLGIEPKDWDVATSARPEEVQKIFPDSVYENQFGTVGVKLKTKSEKRKTTLQNSKKEKVKNESESEEKTEIVEVTTYRIESKYSDKRHPDEVKFAKTLEEDLSRRDFTVNAMALKVGNNNQKDFEVVDLFEGQKDLKKRLIRAVDDPHERFDEDALRMMRAVRFAAYLEKEPEKKEAMQGWEIEEKTFVAIKKNTKNLKLVSKERIKDEFEKIILSSNPAKGVRLLMETELMWQIVPELMYTREVRQNHHHYYGPYNTVDAHLVASLEKCPSKKLEVRLASLFHDIGKPASKRGKGEMATFHGHEYISAKMTKRILERLKFPRKVIDKTVLLVKNHMFYYNVDEVGESGVRRVVRKVGLENINDLIDLRIADRLGSGVPKAVPYKLRHFKYMVEKVSKDPISVKQLKLKGDELMKELKIDPGPKVGAILEILLASVVEGPKLNTKKKLLERAKELKKEDLSELKKLAKERVEEEQQKEEKKSKSKHWVK